MATFAVYIEKSVAFQGTNDDVFGNTYHFDVGPATDIDDEALALYVAEAERSLTLAEVSFTRWSTWGPTDGAEIANVMRGGGDLTGTGAISTTQAMYREVCALVVWPMERSQPLNRRRWLRKFLRSAPGSSSFGTNVLEGSEPLSTASLNAFEQYASDIRNAQIEGQDHLLSNENGEIANAPGFARPYLRTRQIGR